MKIWKISGIGLVTLFIIAKDLDSAFAHGRKINKNYDTGQMVKKLYD